MNEEALLYSFELFSKDGYEGSIEDYKELIKTNEEALKHSYDLFSKDGYEGDEYKFQNLVGVEPVKTEAVATETAPVAAGNQAVDTGLASEDISLESQSTDPFVVNGKPVTEEEYKKAEAANYDDKTSYLSKLWTDINKGSSSLGEMMASIPETIYDIFAIPQNIVAKMTGNDSISASSKKFKKITGISNPILDFYEKESEALGKVQDIYNNKNYEYQGIYKNFKNGNYLDAFKQMGSGIAESAPVSISMMVGGAATTTGKLAAGSTVAMAGPEIKNQLENEAQSSLASIVKGIGLAGAESVFSSIGTGTLGKVYKDILLKEGKEEGVKIFRNGLIEMYATALKKAGAPAAMVGEGIEEVATTITQNMINGVGAFDNVADSFIQGVGGGSLYGAPINVSKAKKAVQEGIVNVKINRNIKDSEFTNATEPFASSDVSKLQLDILKNKGAFQLINSKVDREVLGGRLSKEDGDKIKTNIIETQGSINTIDKTNITNTDKVAAVNLLKEKRETEQKIKSINDSSLTQTESDRIKVINEKLNSLVQKGNISKSSANLGENIESIEKLAGDIKGVNIKPLDNAKAIDDYIKDNNLDIDKKASEQQGFIFQNKETGEQTIIINKDVAAKERAVNVAAHEFLHALLFQTVKDSPTTQVSLGNSLKSYLDKVDADQVKDSNFAKRLDQYKQDPNNVKAEEVITLFSDALATGDIKFNENVFTKIGDVIRRALQSVGVSVKFNNGKDVYNFVKDYNKSVSKGKLTKAQIKASKGVKGSLVAEGVTATSKTDTKLSKSNKELGNEIKALVPEGTSKSRYDNQVIGNVYEKLVFGTTLDGLINGQLNKYGVVGDNVYGKPKDIFLEDVKAQLYEKSLMRFNPETNDDLGGFVVNELIKYRIGDVVNRYKKEAGVEGKSLDVAAGEVGSVQEVADESMSIEDQIDLDATQARSETRLTKATKIMSKEQYDKAAKIVEEKLKDIDPKKLSYKKIGGLATDVLSEITDVPAGKILDSTKNLSKEETSRGAMFIEKNIDYIRKTLPKGAVQEAATEKLMGTATGVANSILKRLYDKNPRIKKGAGLSPWSIKPNLTNQDVLDAIGRPKREDGRKIQINPRSPEGQVIKGILNLVDRNIANELARTVESDLTLEQKQDVAAGKSNTMFSKSFNLGLEAGSNTDNIASVLFSKSARENYEQVLRAKRPELKNVPEQVDNLIKWADSLDIKDDKKAKYKKLGLFYMANGYAIFPEDGYKITESIRLATINKIDPYAFKNPNELIEKYEKVTKIARVDPDSISEFSNKEEIAGYAIYDVQDSKKGQEAVRKVVDSNWGEKSNPWCLVARTNDTYLGHEEAYSEKEVKDIIDTNEALGNTVERAGHYMSDGKKIYELVVYAPKNGGELARSFGLWKGYNESGNGFKIAFKNGKLNSFRDGNDMLWWDRMDKPKKGPDMKAKPDANGLRADGYFDLESGYNVVEGYVKDYKKGNLTIEERYNKDKELKNRDTFGKTKNSNKSLVESYSMEKLNGDDYIETKTKYRSASDRTETTTKKLGSSNTKNVRKIYYDENDNFIENIKYENIKTGNIKEETIFTDSSDAGSLEGFTIYKAETINGKKNVSIDERKNFISSNVLFSKESSFAKKPSLAIEKLLIKEFINGKHKGKVSSRTKNRYAKNIKELLEYGGINGIDNFEKAVEAGNYTENELELINFVFEGRDWLFGLFQNEKEQNQGIKLEKLIKVAIKKIGLKDVDLNLSEGGFSSGVDIVLSTKQGRLNIELKLNEKARVGSFSIKRAGDTFSYTKGAEGLETKTPELHEAMQEALKGDEHQKAWRKYTEEGIKIGKKLLDSGKVDIETYVDEDTGQLVGPKEVFELLKKNKYQKALTISIDKVKIKNKNGKEVDVPLDQKVIELLYNNKDVHDINFGGTGMYALGESISGMPKLEADVVVNIVTSRSGSSSGVYRSIQRATPFIKIIRSTTNIDLADLSQVEPNIKSLVKSIESTKNSKSLNLDKEFNDIIENKTGIESYKNYKKVKAQVTGASKGKFNFFIAPSAEDFVGLLYKTLGKGKIGDAQMAWYKENLLDPYARAMEKVSKDRNFMARNFLAIKKELKIVPKNLKKKIPGEPFTQEQAIRVYIWNKKGSTIPGISENDDIYLTNFVENNEKLKTFADQVISLSGIEDYAKPSDSWVTGTITTDILEALNTTKRKKYLELWQQNVDEIFSEKNLNKLEAAYGADYRKALENILGRMKTGRNRAFGGDSLSGRFVDWMTGATGAIMFFNTRSAILQTLSSVNFINFGDNNIFAATKAFANQKQYWSDFKMLFNSEFLVERRDGLKINVNEADIADIAKEKGVRGIINKLLKLGFTPTQLADSFAIATGGATFYRNRLKALIKDGMDPVAAEKQAMRDFRETAEESQQSSRPDKISAQQAGPLGRTILAFANTPSQYARIIKKAASDIKNGRGDLKTNVSKIMYYAVAQNLIFNTLQQAFFATLFDEEEELIDDKTINVANSMADSLLRGIGISGAIISVVKNTALRWVKEEEKSNPKYENAILELVKISPPVSSKINKLRAVARSYSWDKDEMKERGFSIDNPAGLAIGNVVSATTNIPLDRVIKKMQNIKAASDSEIETYKRIFLLAGWSKWELGIKEPSKKKKKKRRVKIISD